VAERAAGGRRRACADSHVRPRAGTTHVQTERAQRGAVRSAQAMGSQSNTFPQRGKVPLPFGRRSGESALSVSMAGGPQPWSNAQPAAGAGDARIHLSGLGPERPMSEPDVPEGHAVRSAQAMGSQGNTFPQRGKVPLPFGRQSGPDNQNSLGYRCTVCGSPLPFGRQSGPDVESAETIHPRQDAGSPLPFGRQSGPDKVTTHAYLSTVEPSPLPFGRQSGPDSALRSPSSRTAGGVSIAFRQAVRSGLDDVMREAHWRKAKSPLPFGRQSGPDSMLTTKSKRSIGLVSIAFRQAVRSGRQP